MKYENFNACNYQSHRRGLQLNNSNSNHQHLNNNNSIKNIRVSVDCDRIKNCSKSIGDFNSDWKSSSKKTGISSSSKNLKKNKRSDFVDHFNDFATCSGFEGRSSEGNRENNGGKEGGSGEGSGGSGEGQYSGDADMNEDGEKTGELISLFSRDLLKSDDNQASVSGYRRRYDSPETFSVNQDSNKHNFFSNFKKHIEQYGGISDSLMEEFKLQHYLNIDETPEVKKGMKFLKDLEKTCRKMLSRYQLMVSELKQDMENLQRRVLNLMSPLSLEPLPTIAPQSSLHFTTQRLDLQNTPSEVSIQGSLPLTNRDFLQLVQPRLSCQLAPPTTPQLSFIWEPTATSH